MESDGDFRRRVAIVTGAAQGVGLGIARVLAEAGLSVALADKLGERAGAESLRLNGEGRDTIAVTLNVTSADDWARAVAEVVARWGRLDVLVNNAGISPRGNPETTDEALFDLTLAVNLKGPWLGIRAAVPWLKATRGTVINIGSTRATRPMPGLFPYVTSKAGLWGLTRQVAVEYLEDGVTCNMVAPGWVDTENERSIQAAYGRPDFPSGLRNILLPEEIGGAVAYLVSPAGRKVNGVTLYLDSGLHVADNAGMVYLPPGLATPPYPQRLSGTGLPGGTPT